MGCRKSNKPRKQRIFRPSTFRLQNRVPGEVASAAGGGNSERNEAQRSKFAERERRSEFRAPQEGLRSNFEAFCPCHEKRQVSTETCRFSMISVPAGTGDIPSV